MEKHVNSSLSEEERRNYHITDDEMTMLREKYKLPFRTATAFDSFDNHTKRWMFRMLELAYEAGQNERK